MLVAAGNLETLISTAIVALSLSFNSSCFVLMQVGHAVHTFSGNTAISSRCVWPGPG